MFCSQCGKENSSDSAFCKKCGSKQAHRYAGFKIRFGAFFIDFIGVIIMAFLLAFICGFLGIYNQSTVDTMGIFLDYIVYIIYFTFFLTIWSTTPGKKLYGLEVLKDDHSHLDFPTSFIRSVLQPLSFVFFGAGFWNIDKDPRKKAWHDRRAHTIVEEKKLDSYLIPAVFTIIGIILYLYLQGLESGTM